MREKDINVAIKNNMPVIKMAMYQVTRKFPEHINKNDFLTAAMLGFKKAYETWDETKSSFSSWMFFNISNKIIDEARQNDYLSRGLRKQTKLIEQAKLDLLQNQIEPTEHNIASRMSISVEQLRLIIFRKETLQTAIDIGRAKHSFADTFQKDEIRIVLEKLSKQAKEIITLIYLQGFLSKEVALKLKVSESRVSQVHKQAKQKIAKILLQISR
jgi:RNA polymerase sigma factor for flagellar operon FliA